MRGPCAASVVAAISGVKNSGKTTLMVKLVEELSLRGYRVCTVKHDGHEFKADHPGTDSFRHKKAGAVCSMVYSKGQLMMVRSLEDEDFTEILSLLPPCDFILVEGMKFSSLPKIEVVRSTVSSAPVCDPETLLALVSDLPLSAHVPVLPPDDVAALAELLIRWRQKELDERTQ